MRHWPDWTRLCLALSAACCLGSCKGGGGSGSGATGGQTATGGRTGAGGRPGGTGGPAAGGSVATGGSAGLGGSGAGGRVGGGSGGTTGRGGTGGGATGGAGGLADPGTAPSAIAGLKIDPNPQNVLSCFVSWTTDQAANSVVRFGAGTLQWEISDPTLVTRHQVLVIGMKAQQTYTIEAISANGGGQVSGQGTFTTGALPATIPVGTVMIDDTSRSQAGWTLMNVQKGDGTMDARSTYPPQAVMYDSDGQPVWYYIDGTAPDIGGAVSTQLTDKGVLIGPTWSTSGTTTGTMPIEVDLAGNTVWQCATAVCGGSKNFTHHASKLSNGDYALIEYVTKGSQQNPIFREVSPDNQIVWSLDWSQMMAPPPGATGDWCHANSITIDVDKDAVYANCRWMGLMKTTYQNPAPQWLLQGTYTKNNPGDFSFTPPAGQFSDAHDPEVHDDGTICFYDNGGYSPGAAAGQYHSRAVEYQIDESAKTAKLIWEFPGTFAVPDAWYTTKWYSPFWGDVDRLPNGNFLITGGIRSPTVESRVFEVTKDDGKVVWEFRFPPDYGVYRADRITPPLVHAIGNP
jgi:hypothetical protein